MLTDSVSALSIGKRIASGCEFHWTPKENNKAGSCTWIKPDGEIIEFEVDEHDVPYLMERRTTAVPAQIMTNRENTTPMAAPASQRVSDPETGQGGPWPFEDDRARRDQRLRSVLRESRPVPEPPIRGTIASSDPPEHVAYDYSEVDEENENDLRRRGDKQFLTEDAKSLTHLCTHLPKNPYCTSCVRAKVNQNKNVADEVRNTLSKLAGSAIL